MAALAMGLLAFSADGDQTHAAGAPRVAAGFGEVPGQDLLVHVVVVVAAGQSDQAAVHAALVAQGARPFNHADFSFTGMVHDRFSDGSAAGDSAVNVYINAANDPAGVSLDSALAGAFPTWSAVTPSAIVISDAGDTTACPSLVRECPGRQRTNGQNEASFLVLKGGNTLGVTWYQTSTDEFDMAFNLNFDWQHGTGAGIDLDTVSLHEVGHGLGLGHSDVNGAVMEPYYEGVRTVLHADDEAGLNALYGGGGGVEPTPTPTPDPAADVEAVVISGGLSATEPYPVYSNRETVLFTVHASDASGGDVAGAIVEARVVTASGKVLSGSTTTDSSGDARFSLKLNTKRDGTGLYSVTATADGVDTGEYYFMGQ